MPFDCTGTSISITFGILISWWSNHSRFWSWQDNGGLRESKVDPPGTPDTDWPEQLLQTWVEFFGALIFLPTSESSVGPFEGSGCPWLGTSQGKTQECLTGSSDSHFPHQHLWEWGLNCWILNSPALPPWDLPCPFLGVPVMVVMEFLFHKDNKKISNVHSV